MTDETWTPGEEGDGVGDGTPEDGRGADEDDEPVLRRRGKTRIEATRSPGRSGRDSRSFVVRKGRLEAEDAEEDR